MKLLAFVLVSVSIVCAQETVDKSLTILSAKREIDISTQVVKYSVELEIENGGSAGVSSFLFALDANEANRLAYIHAFSVEDEKNKLKLAKASVKSASNDETYFKIDLAHALKPSKKDILKVEAWITHSLSPFPTEITQAEQQLVVYTGNVHLLSPYTIKSEETVVNLNSEKVESHTKKPEPVKHDGKKITYGPYTNVAPLSKQEMRIHYENSAPFLVVGQLTRVIEVSHWGNIAVEETLEASHKGARLKGSFSRLDFQRDHRGDGMPAVKTYKTLLPSAARDVYYRDEIGNISTSNMRVMDEAVQLEIRPRFPLFGGWKTNYYIGYNIPSYEYLYSSGNDFALKMRFIDHIFDGFVVDEMTLKVILPEGSRNIKLSTPYNVKRSADETHYTYLDTAGRPVVIAHKTNLVDKHIQDFELHYKFDRLTMIREPLMLIVAFYGLFLVVIVFVRLDFTIAKDVVSESRIKVQGLVVQLTDAHAQRQMTMEAWLEALTKFRTSKDAAALGVAKKKADGELKTLNAQTVELQAQMKIESPETSDKVAELQKLAATSKDLLTTLTQSVERLVGGKLNKTQFADAEKTFKTKFEETRDRMDQIVYGL